MSDATVWTDVVQLGKKAAKVFDLPQRKKLRFEPLLKNRCYKRDADCGHEPGLIRIRLHRCDRPRIPLTRGTIMSSLAHELAHLREPNHGAAFGELTRQIAAWLREQGQPVSHRMHVGSGPRPKDRPSFKRAWKDPRPR